MDEMKQLKKDLEKFNKDRDWEQFHSPKNIAMALSVEVSEIVELFQWLGKEESYNLDEKKIQRLKDELGDVFLYLQLLASKYDIDLVEVGREKLKRNEKKYPVEKARGSAKKYNEL